MIMVVGPGRCGTSAVAGFIHKLGVKMTDTPEFCDESNPVGFYEDIEFLKLNDAMTRRKITTRRFIVGLRALIDSKKEPWGLKHPATSEFMPVYLSLLGDDIRFVRMRRNPDDVVNSMSKQYGWSQEQSLHVTLRREALLDCHLKDYPVLEVQFSDLRNREVLENIAEFVGMPLNEEAVSHIITPDEIEYHRQKVAEYRAEMATA